MRKIPCRDVLYHTRNTLKGVLGAAHLDSTLIYTKVDLVHLKTVALSIEELLR
jgi:hypothetical protein